MSRSSKKDLLVPEQAIVLAAGFGTRLLPLTKKIPKPALPVGGVPMIYFNICLLKDFGVREVMVNLHHFPEQLKKIIIPLAGPKFKIRFSLEKKILGTAGGIAQALRNMKSKTTLILNGDVLTDINLEKLTQWHLKNQAMATLACIEPSRAKVKDYVESDKNHKIHRIAGLPNLIKTPQKLKKGIFSGIQILEPPLFKDYPSGKFGCLARQIYQVALQQQSPLQAYWHLGDWWDLGSLESLSKVDQRLWQGKTSKKVQELWKKSQKNISWS